MNTLPFRRTRLSSMVLVTLLGAPPAYSATAYGPEFHVNTAASGNQTLPRVAMDALGDFVVVWQTPDGNGYGISAQRYDFLGQPRGGELRVNTDTSLAQDNPFVAMNAVGEFVVTYNSLDGVGSYGVFLQRFDADGVPQGVETRVNTPTSGHQMDSAVAMDADGDFVVAWESVGQDGSGYGVFAQRFNAAGVAQGVEFRVNTTTTLDQKRPAVAMDADGNFVVAWESTSGDGYASGVFARRYDAAGTALGGEFQVNTYVTSSQGAPAVAASGQGFVIAWASYGQDGSFDGVYAQRYSAQGESQGPEFRVNSFASLAQTRPAVAMGANGDFIVSWDSYQQDGEQSGVYAKRYDAEGQAVGGEFRVNGHTEFTQRHSSVAFDADNDLAIVYESSYELNAFGAGVNGRRFRTDLPIDLSLTQVDSADPVVKGTALTYTLTVSNLNPQSTLTGIAAIDSAFGAATAVRVADVFPSGVTGVGASVNGPGSCLIATAVNCTFSTPLLAGTSRQVTVTMTAPPVTGTLVNHAGVRLAQADAEPDNNHEAERTRVVCADSFLQFSTGAIITADEAATQVLTVNRTGGNCGAASVQFETLDGTALAGRDYNETSGTLSWADGELGAKTLSVPLIDDGLDERNEALRVNLFGNSGAFLGNPRLARIVITDDDAPPRVNFTQRAQAAGEADGLVTLTLALNMASGRDVQVPVSYGGTATPNSDFFAPGTASFVIPAGSLSASFRIEINEDIAVEAPETVIATIGTPVGAVKGTIDTFTLTINSND